MILEAACGLQICPIRSPHLARNFVMIHKRMGNTTTRLLAISALFLVLIFVVTGFVILAHPFSNGVLGASTRTPKTSFTIAVYGDSFVDTMGEHLEYLQGSLQRRYPTYHFTFYNYGIGSQNVQMGLDRFDSPFNYKTRNYPPIAQVHPDIIIVGSFGYNPFSPYSRDQHWNTLVKLVQKAQSTGASVYMLSEIAPLKTGFGKGPHGVNWPDDQANLQAQHITEQLQNAVSISKNLHVPLIDAYDPSKVNGNFGNPIYVNKDDGIHPSDLGHKFMADLIAKTIKLN
jgi:lysophospholipase L1-like esterase